MKSFYENYRFQPKLAPLLREISWIYNPVIIEKCKDNLKREFYIHMSRKYGWSKNVLIQYVENQNYEKILYLIRLISIKLFQIRYAIKLN
ncbi:DUF1016 N-terminal domain-containing protein [Coxiella-like endosymbiont]|uniref:DUF1016 N-terminal domain-containing protein n=1 Tax=Coxiella-like endosymbiont TaxID=1592897 RepID=UPI0034E2DC45